MRHERQHFALAIAQPLDRIARGAARTQLFGDHRIDDAAAGGDRAARGDELVELADALLQQIADTGGVVVEQVGRRARFDVLRQDEHGHARDARRGSSPRRAGLRRSASAACGCR